MGFEVCCWNYYENDVCPEVNGNCTSVCQSLLLLFRFIRLSLRISRGKFYEASLSWCCAVSYNLAHRLCSLSQHHPHSRWLEREHVNHALMQSCKHLVIMMHDTERHRVDPLILIEVPPFTVWTWLLTKDTMSARVLHSLLMEMGEWQHQASGTHSCLDDVESTSERKKIYQ